MKANKSARSFQKILIGIDRYIFNSPFFVLSATLVIIAVILFALNLFVQQQLVAYALNKNPFATFETSPYPLVERAFIPTISADAAIVVDTSSRVVLFSKNADVRLSPASTTKIMTALTALDWYHPTDMLTVQRDYVEGSGLHLQKGDSLTFEDLLYAMLLPSANDAAYTIADNYPGGFTTFVDKMNEKVRLFGLPNTHFLDPAGLEDDGDYTTAKDLATIASFAINHPLFAKIVATRYATITTTKGNSYQLMNLNKLLGYYGVNGIKTGTTDLAGQVLVTSALISGHQYVLVVMKSEDRFADTEKLLKMLTENVNFVPIHP